MMNVLFVYVYLCKISIKDIRETVLENELFILSKEQFCADVVSQGKKRVEGKRVPC